MGYCCARSRASLNTLIVEGRKTEVWRMTSSDKPSHCYNEIDQKPPIFDQKPLFADFCVGSSNGQISTSVGNLPMEAETSQAQTNSLYTGYPNPTNALNGAPYFYPFGAMSYPTNNSTPQTTPFMYPQSSTSPESMLPAVFNLQSRNFRLYKRVTDQNH